MLSFNEFVETIFGKEQPETLDEKALVLGKKAYPKEGNILILAGGAGSGKGFASNKVIAFDGKRFDVDELKNQLIAGKSKTIAQKFKDETGRDITSLSLSNPKDVETLHGFVKNHKYDKKVILNFINSQKNVGNKQNVIFDVTMKDVKKLQDIAKYAENGGYDKKNIHLVWILNRIDIALKQNEDPSRGRVVPKDILIQSHEGVAETLNELLNDSEKCRQYLDGDIWIIFNNRENQDLIMKFVPDKDTGKMKMTNVVEKYTAIKLKEQGKPIKKPLEISKEILDKIISYIPDKAKETWKLKH